MNVQKLNDCIAAFRAALETKKFDNSGPYWETLHHFQNNWDIDAPDFAAMYDRCLQNSQTKRMWKREAWEPKVMLMLFAKMQPEFVRHMFKDLYDEEKDVMGRISRFKFGLDALLLEYKENNPRRIDNNHYHDDSEMIHFYLAMRFPEKYSLFDYPAFRKMTELLRVKEPPSPFETDRFFKMTKIWLTFLSKDKELVDLHQAAVLQQGDYKDVRGLMVFEFYRGSGG